MLSGVQLRVCACQVSIRECVLMQSVEVSSDGKRLLRRLFTSFDVNEDGLLSDAEQNEMFSASPSRSAEVLPLFWIHVICLSS